MTTATNRPADDGLEDRLAAAFDRAVARATLDVQNGAVAVGPLRDRRQPRRTWRLALATAIGLAGVALLLGVVRLPQVQPLPVGASATPSSVASPVATAPVPSSGAVNSTVYPVGSGAAERISAAFDGTEFVVSGWILGSEPACPIPSTLSWDTCPAIRLHPSMGGGPGIDVYRIDGPTAPLVDPLFARPVTVRVHTHDVACGTPTCRGLAVLTEYVAIGPEQLPSVAPETQIPLVSEADAIATAVAAAGGSPLDYFVMGVAAGPVGQTAPLWPEVDANRTVWTVTLRRAEFVPVVVEERTFVVDDQTGVMLGTSTMTRSATPLPVAGTVIPDQLDGVAVATSETAGTAIGRLKGSLLVGGWIQGIDRRVCDASATPATALDWSPCVALWLHPDSGGGAPIEIDVPADVRASLPQPADGASVPIVLQVHGIDLTWGAPGVGLGQQSGRVARVDGVVWTGATVRSTSMGTAPAGVSLAAARTAASFYKDHYNQTFAYGVPMTLGAFEAIFGGAPSGPGTTKDTWVWVLFYTDGTSTARSAGAVVIRLVDGQPVVGMSSLP
jgi:hypothetical protein